MATIDAHTIFGFWPERRADITVDTLLRLMSEHGIDRALTLSTGGVFADFRHGNEETLEQCQEHPDRLLPVGTVDPRRFVGTREEIDKWSEQGVRVWRLFPRLQGWEPEGRPVVEILKRLADRGATLLIDAAEVGAPQHIADLTADMKLPTVLLGVTMRHLGTLVAMLGDYPHIRVETRRLADPQVIAALAGKFGPERLVFGSAAPLQYLSSARLPLDAASLEEAARERIMGGNVAELLGETGG